MHSLCWSRAFVVCKAAWGLSNVAPRFEAHALHGVSIGAVQHVRPDLPPLLGCFVESPVSGPNTIALRNSSLLLVAMRYPTITACS